MDCRASNSRTIQSSRNSNDCGRITKTTPEEDNPK
jgi:hypothetical protein